ncbi:MAG TPA: DUF448 domain-containing protein [Actinobacteria bacterium]|nr:DUF448 domain-containing protein [Actinomycetota bacterium]
MTSERTCVGCRTRAPAELLLRVAIQGGSLRPGRNLPGRGAWLHPDLGCLNQAERRSAFGRALRHTGPIDTAGIRSHLEGLAPDRFAL